MKNTLAMDSIPPPPRSAESCCDPGRKPNTASEISSAGAPPQRRYDADEQEGEQDALYRPDAGKGQRQHFPQAVPAVHAVAAEEHEAQNKRVQYRYAQSDAHKQRQRTACKLINDCI